jgi:hypothetical protein
MVDDQCIVELCDPDGMDLSKALRFIRRLSAADSDLAERLSAFIEYLCGYPYPNSKTLERAMWLMRGISDAKRFARFCERLCQTDNPVAIGVVRSVQARGKRQTQRATPSADVQKVA